MIKLVILDIDGVMTDGKKCYGIDGIPFSKTYCDKDFTAIKRLRGSGVHVCFLSGDERINLAMAKNRRIDFYSSRGLDKADFINDFQITYQVTPNEMVYVGDDLFDLSIMKSVGHSFCPEDSPDIVRALCSELNIIPRKGGENVVTKLVDMLLERSMIKDCSLNEIEQLDKHEKF